MNRAQAATLIQQTFTRAFDKTRFLTFARNLLNHIDESKATLWSSQYVKDAFKDHVQRYERLGTYSSLDSEKVDVLIVYLTAESKLERARTAIRNFVADHLKTRDEMEAALVAFVSPSEAIWRFSYVRMDYATTTQASGRVGVETRLTPARRFSYLVGEGESCHTAQVRFLGLLQDTETPPSLSTLEEAFSVEAVTEEFFTQYAALFLEFTKALEKVLSRDKSLRDEFKAKGVQPVEFSKKLMGQIVFLYFLQKKGWLGVQKGRDWGTGPSDFLRTLANGDHGGYDNFFNDMLEPLFYDSLATDRGATAWCKHFNCRIPFLNGGLFEPLGDYDWRKTNILLPNRLFTNTERVEEGVTGTGVLDVFDRYNFTVNEAEPLEKEVAIDPEMLGKVFENLIEENRRKGLGAFYTPRDIVHYMCQESLVNYLDASLNLKEVPLAQPKPKQQQLFGIREPEQDDLKKTVRDEVVPREDLHTFVHIGEQISHYESVQARYAIRMPRSIERHARQIDDQLASITICDPAVGSGAFPVGMMTEIVRARCALTPYFDDGSHRTPYHFKRHAIQHCLYGVDIDASAVDIAKLRLWLSLVVDEDDVKHIKPLPNLDYKIVAGNSLIGIDKTLFNVDLFTHLEELKPLYFNETNTAKKHRIRRDIDSLIHRLTHNKQAFDFEIYFSEIFHHNHGFDVVIGNPPYDVLSEKETKDPSVKILMQYAKSHPVLCHSIRGKGNLYKLFVCKGLSLTGKSGVLCFIVPMSLLGDDQAKTVRSYLFSNGTFAGVDAFPQKDDADNRVFRSAKVATCIFQLQRGPACDDQEFFVRIHSGKAVDAPNDTILHTTYRDIKTVDADNLLIPVCSGEDWKIIRRIINSPRFARLGDIATQYQGEVNETSDKACLSKTRGTPVLRGANITLYGVRAASQGETLYVDSEKYLRKRSRSKRAAHHTRRRLGFQRSAPQNNFRRLIAAPIDPGNFCFDTVSYVPEDATSVPLEILAALLNSHLADFFFRCFSTNSKVNEYQFNLLPFFKVDSEKKPKNQKVRYEDARTCLKASAHVPGEIMAFLVDSIRQIIRLEAARTLTSRRERAYLSSEAQELQDQVDSILFDIFSLNESEVKYVQQRLKQML